ncbi:MAG: AAA family ATPase [Patescibacteria group bacterium]
MFLQKLDIQGFKTFAKKTTLAFHGPKNGDHALTTIVGPNGSGKSNLADAIRWALGEQSLKLLRGKFAEDVIFAGAEGKARSGFAEVSLTFNNEDHAMPIEFSEVTITRRLYRDGTSEYLLNGSTARLQDIQLLLAQANVGQRSYSVIAQGMIDHVLVASPEERKDFFDDATGVKQFQIKRHQAVLKLKRTYENLSEVEMILNEIEPRLRTLKRQVNRLEQREEVEKELRELQWNYYSALWLELLDGETTVQEPLKKIETQINDRRSMMSVLENRLEALAKTEVQDDSAIELQNRYRKLQRERTELCNKEFTTQKEIELAKVRVQSSWIPLPLSSIVEMLKSLLIEKDLKKLYEAVRGILKKLERPSPEEIKPDTKLLKELNEIRKDIKALDRALKEVEKEIDDHSKNSQKERTALFEIQKELRAHQTLLYELEQRCNASRIELARLEERKANLSREIDTELKERSIALKSDKIVRTKKSYNTEQTYPEIQRLKYKLELIGGIDEETIKEYNETKERFEFLDTQVSDLRKAIAGIEKVVDELDKKIAKQSEKAFSEINKEFQRYFKVLFGGGSCSLVKVKGAEMTEMEEGTDATGMTEYQEAHGVHHHEGVEIQATPPGKKLKALNLLSGGERALTAIALLSAIMSTNPSPFVVLDEVDAALDESNTVRFAAILDELRKFTQFIVITHNRATMEKSDILYGVTMGDDGVSNLISVNLSEVEKNGTARH